MSLALSGTTGISGINGSSSTPAVQGSDSNTGLSFGSDIVNINTNGVIKAHFDTTGSEIHHNDGKRMATFTEGVDVFITGNSGLRVRGDVSNVDPRIVFRRKSNDGNTSEPAKIQMEYFAGTTHESGHLDFYTNGDSGSAALNHRIRNRNNEALFGDDTSIGSFSDERLKKDITDYTYDLSKFKQLRPRTFNWINPSEHIPHSTVIRGFTAQEVEAVDSYWIDENDVRNPKDSVLVADTNNRAKSSTLGASDAMYVSVIKQLIEKIETLETKVAALEAA